MVGAAALMGNETALAAASAKNVWVDYPLDPLPGQWWVLPAWFALALAGVVVQLATTSKIGKKKSSRKPAAA